MPQPTASWKTTLLVSLLIAGVGAGLLVLIFSTEPEAKRSGATKKTPMLVDVVHPEVGTFTPTLVGHGTVVAERDVELSPRVSGSVVHRSESFSPGSFVREGEVLLRLDPASFRITLATRKSELAQAKTALSLELGQHQLAKEEARRLFQGDLTSREKELMLREPQLAAARETVDAAEQAVQQAKLQLAWTVVQAPFDAHVLTRTVDVGAQVSPGMALGRLVGVDEYWVEATLPLDQRRWLQFPNQGAVHGAEPSHAEPSESGCSEVTLVNRTSWPPGVTRRGCLRRLIGALDEGTRMARVLITVDDPLGRAAAKAGGGSGEKAAAGAQASASGAARTPPPLVLGEFLEARIPGLPVEDAARVPREFLRKNQSVWLARDGQLAIVKLEPLLFDAEAAYVERGALGGAPLITTHLASVSDGAPVRIRDGSAESASPPKKAADKRRTPHQTEGNGTARKEKPSEPAPETETVGE